MNKLIYPLLFLIGVSSMSWIDLGHILWSRWYIHNIYTAYFIFGSAVGIMFNYFFKIKGDSHPAD